MRLFWGYVKANNSKIIYVILFAFVFMLLFKWLQKKGWMKDEEKGMICTLKMFLLSLSCSFIFVMTLFGRLAGDYGLKIIPFESYCKAFNENNTELILQLMMNIAMYIPLGFLLPCCFKRFDKCRYVMLMATVSSLSIELLQVIFRIGLFETDDILNNVIGAMMGLMIYVLITKIVKK